MRERTQINSLPEHAWQLPRREILKQMAGGLAALTALSATENAVALAGPPGALRVSPLAPVERESFWQEVKAQFPLRPGLILVNAANLCPSPYLVQETVFGLTGDIDADASFQNRNKFSDLTEDSRRKLAIYLGAHPEEIVLTRNTSESNNIVVNGLDLGNGDEVLLWDQNHPTNNVAWEVKARRYGFQVRKVTTPVSPQDPEDLVHPFLNALTRKTKVLGLTHVSNISGVGLPVKTLCRMAREREVLTLIDGAQTFGAFPVDLHDIGCDFYSGSAHKWFLGPKETGVLYVRREQINRLWPSVVGASWEDLEEKGARKFETLGQRDDAALAAVGKAVEFHQQLGKERIGERIRTLAGMLKEELGKLPGAKLYTPQDSELSGGVVVVSIPETDPKEGFEYLYRRHKIGCAGIGGHFPGIRFCPHIYNPVEEINKIVSAVADLAKNGIQG